MSYKNILYEVDGPILTLTLNRPDKLNAWLEDPMGLELMDALDRSDADDNIRAVIVTGAGRAFCAGADLEAGSMNRREVLGRPDLTEDSIESRDGGGRWSLRIYNSLKPVIAAINGPAVGIGITMTLPMDFRLASKKSRMGFVFARIGAVNEGCSTYFLPKAVGMQQAMEWVYTGRVFDAEEALKTGLVRSLHEPEDLLPAARKLALEIAENTAPVSIAMMRQAFWRTLDVGHPIQAHRLETKGLFHRGLAKDSREGIAAFLEKRKANFPDKVSKDMPPYFPWWEEPEF